jgi:hypothetical protein
LSLVAIVGRDLIIATRIGEAAVAAGHKVVRVDQPSDLPPASSVTTLFVDWGDRHESWGATLGSWLEAAAPGRPRVVAFGPHTDLAAHSEARAAGIGPMLARSKLVAGIHELVAPRP